jgi:hypothetical protein
MYLEVFLARVKDESYEGNVKMINKNKVKYNKKK